jgi:hypothetical protein
VGSIFEPSTLQVIRLAWQESSTTCVQTPAGIPRSGGVLQFRVHFSHVTRRDFVRVVPTLGAFVMSANAADAQGEPPAWPEPPAPAGSPVDERFPTQHEFLVKEMVGVSHNNLARVIELVQEHQTLAKASWDWGFGDWETALGAASHVGQRAIAAFLIDNGAPPTIFSAAMLGQLDVVTAFAAAMPNVLSLRGPHGIPLINHARAGGPQAAPVLKFLESLPADSGAASATEQLTSESRSSIEGRYVFGSRARDWFTVDFAQNTLGITRAGASRRVLTYLGHMAFAPVGAPEVCIQFDTTERRLTLSVFDPDVVVVARKV